MRDELATVAEERLNLSSNATKIYNTVYNKQLEDGRKESAVDRMAAVAVDIASADMKYLPKKMSRAKKLAHVRSVAERNLEMYVTNEFRANTPTNINMGRWRANYDKDGNLTGRHTQPKQLGSACFVIPIADTFGRSVYQLDDGILEAWLTQQQVHKGGGGTGVSFQRLRPKGSKIGGYNPAIDGMESMSWDAERGVSSGADSFLEHYYNASTEAVKQGNSRRGANMGIQRIDHMDFLDQIFAKFGNDRYRKERRIKNFNLSLAVTDEFMEAALNGGTYTLYNPHRAQPGIRRVLEKKFGVKNPEIVRKSDLATREQFEKIQEMNRSNEFHQVTTPNMYLDNDGVTVINAYTGEPIGIVIDDVPRIYADKVLDIISKLSHATGEPGMVFIDRMNEFNANLYDDEMEATNPCGEQPLPPYDACNLGSINLGKFVKHEIVREGEASSRKVTLEDRFTKTVKRKDGQTEVISFDWQGLKRTIHDGVHFLDNVIERSDFPSPKIKKAVEQNRNIGLGYMGVWDAMVLMKMRYGSGESLQFADELAKVLHEESLKASQKLSEERGAYPLYKTSHHNPDSDLYKWLVSNPETIPDRFRGERKLSKNVDRERIMTYGGGPIRNSARTTEAPTGTIRRTVGEKFKKLGLDNKIISSGVEPIFSLIEKSNIINTQVEDVAAAAAELLDREGLPVLKILDAIKKNRGSAFVYSYTPKDVAEVLKEIPEDVRDVLVTSAGGENDKYEITADQHVKMLTAFQRWNDSATSKTANLPNTATVDEVRDVWVEMWRRGNKGGTVYVDKSRKFQILNVEMGEVKEEKKGQKRPLVQSSITFELPYISSQSSKDTTKGDIDFNPDRCFTTIAYNPVNGGITGIFQNIPEVDPERLSLLIDSNIDKSRSLKQGRSIDEVIGDLEKIKIEGTRLGIVTDEAVIPKGSTNEMKRFEITGATTREAALNSLYFMRYATDSGKNFDEDFIRERLDSYFTGRVSLKSILGTKGMITLKESDGKRPSILATDKVVALPEGMERAGCPECG
jgi:ribonucleoside-diphosphate reductase alpha chain